MKVPTVSPTAPDTVIYMYYGNASATDQSNKNGVWDSNYKAVYHLTQNPAGTAPQLLESTSNAAHLTTAGSMTSGE